MSAGKGRLVMQRVTSGLELSIDGPGADLCAATLVLLKTPTSERAVLDLLRPLDEGQAQSFWALLQEHEVVRPYHHEGRAPRVRGAGSLLDPLAPLLAEGGWCLPPLLVGATWPVEPAVSARRGEVALLLCGGDLVASLARTRPCPRCLMLRRLAYLGKEGEEQTLLLQGRGRIPDRKALRALCADMLLELQKEPLDSGEAIVVQPGEGGGRAVFLVHPDCESCVLRRPPSERAFARDLLKALDDPQPLTPTPGSREALIDPFLGPLVLEVDPGRRGLYPFDSCFVWGSVRLTRWLHEKAYSMSTWGGMHSTHPAPAMAQLIALSEGAERLATKSVRPHIHACPGSDPRMIPSSAFDPRFRDEERERAYCFAVDLVTRAPRLVPYEEVVVGLPKELYAKARRIEPFYSGAASHTTMAQAVVHATLELLGRDAYMISWYRRRALRRLEWPKAPSNIARERARYLRSRGIGIEIFDMTLDAPVTALLVRVTAKRARGNWPEGGALLVAGVGFDAMAALEHALGLACGQFISFALQPSPAKDPLDPAAVRRTARMVPFWRLIVRYFNPRHSDAHAFLGQGKARFEEVGHRAPGTISEKMEVLRRFFEEQSLSWLVTRLTDEPAKEAGFEVVKVVVPGLVSLAPSRADVPFALPRMQRAWPDATREAPNPDPHPLY
ncbi:hypothetical protein BE20_23595 [Sorangium cellulosum]|uniref:YcaO domain-containing protein n=1 Tax=Sorangium cellulosum TaxID=56 RepID=A0A150S7V8_SORCE|nr:hypothetical protein BE18_18455 [Sorangium cellulosum]KYF88218.1 hypothetical protein BE20_23595 [Sorangium cellulosum]